MDYFSQINGHTTVTVEDFDRVRQALGVTHWNVYGESYALMTPPCGVPAVRGTTLPSSICTGAFSQRSM